MSRLEIASTILKEEIRPWLSESGAKPSLTQAREILKLWRLYGYPPMQYLRSRLYRRDYQEITEFMPMRLLMRFRDACNAGVDAEAVVDKLTFARRLRRAGLPVVSELFEVVGPEHIEGPDGPLTREAAEAALTKEGAVFVKPRVGARGQGAFVWRAESPAERVLSLQSALVQPLLLQHEAISVLHPSSVNTIRVDTLAANSRIEVSAAVLRIGARGSTTDHGTSGGLVAPINLATGVVSRPARRMAAFEPDALQYSAHPDTGAPIEGLRIPFWEEVLETIGQGAALLRPLRTLGWDVALTPRGPVLIEANHDWFITLMQLSQPLGATPLGRAALSYHRTGKLPPG